MTVGAPRDRDLSAWAADQARLLRDGARVRAAVETGLDLVLFPAAAPFTVEQALDPDFLP